MKKEKILTRGYIVCILAAFCCILWGSAVPSIKIGYRYLDIADGDYAAQILFAGIRFAFAGIMTILFGSIGKRCLLKPKVASLKYVFVLSMLQTVLQYVPFYIGVGNSTGVKSAILISVGVFISVFVSCFLFRSEKITVRKLAGCLIGIAGIVIVNLAGGNSGMTAFAIGGDGLIILSQISYALSASCIKSFSKKENPVILSGYQFFLGGMIMIIIGMIMGGRITAWNMAGAGIMIYLAFVSAAAYTIWGILLMYNPVSRVAVYGFLNPLCGVILSAVLLHEGSAIDWSFGVALILVCVGIFIASKSRVSEK